MQWRTWHFLRHLLTGSVDHEGYAYAWGCGAFGRLGSGSQRDQPAPLRVQQFARKSRQERVRRVVAGATASAVVDQRQRLWVAGRWRVTGAGGLGQGLQIFYPLLEEHEARAVALGGASMHCVAHERGHRVSDDMDALAALDAEPAFAWGQAAAHGELGARKAAADPTACEALGGVSVVDVAAGRATTFWLVRNVGMTYAELPRYPQHIESPDTCLVCGQRGQQDATTLLACDRCDSPYHLGCLKPPLSQVPAGEWLCDECRAMDPEPAKAEPERAEPARKRRR